MNTTIIDRIGYHQEGDFLIPNIEEASRPQVGTYGLRWLRYMEENHAPLSMYLQMKGKLDEIALKVQEETEEKVMQWEDAYHLKHPQIRQNPDVLERARQMAMVHALAEEEILPQTVYNPREE